jgi:hypothetical protein
MKGHASSTNMSNRNSHLSLRTFLRRKCLVRTSSSRRVRIHRTGHLLHDHTHIRLSAKRILLVAEEDQKLEAHSLLSFLETHSHTWVFMNVKLHEHENANVRFYANKTHSDIMKVPSSRLDISISYNPHRVLHRLPTLH